MFKFEDLLDEVGQFGRYQILTYCIITLCNIPFGWHSLSIIFVGGNQDYWCALPELSNLTSDEQKEIGIPHITGSDDDVVYSRCRRYDFDFTNISEAELRSWNRSEVVGNWTDTIGCSSWIFDQSQYASTIFSEYGLTCDSSWLVNMTQTIYMLGWLLGTPLLGWMSDRFGRRPSFYISFSLLVAFGMVQAFMPNIILYMVTKFLLGAAGGGFQVISLVTIMEVTGMKHRVWVGTFFFLGFNIAMWTLALIAWFVRDHFRLEIIIGCSPVLLLPLFYFILESPRWLLQHHRFDDAIVVLGKMAKVNRRKLHDKEKLLIELKEATLDVERADVLVKRGGQPGIIDVIKIPHLRKISIIAFLQSFCVGSVFFGLFMMPDSLGASAYLSTALAGIASTVAFFVVIPIMNKLGRRWSMGITAICQGVVLCIAAAIMHNKELGPLLVTLVFIARVSVQGGSCTIHLFSAELFPTVVRSQAVGTGSAIGKIGSLVVPQLVLLSGIWLPLPVVILGVMSVIIGFLNYFLPETLNRKLPETLEDGANFGRKNTNLAEKEEADDVEETEFLEVGT